MDAHAASRHCATPWTSARDRLLSLDPWMGRREVRRVWTLMCLLGLENRECQVPDSANPQKALKVKLPDVWSRATPVFDDENLVSCAGLVPVMGLAEQAGLSELIDGRVRFKASRVRRRG